MRSSLGKSASCPALCTAVTELSCELSLYSSSYISLWRPPCSPVILIASVVQLLSCAYDGAVKLWDIRSTLPLYSAPAHEGKALCCAWQNGKIVSGGIDGEVKTYVVPEKNE